VPIAKLPMISLLSGIVTPFPRFFCNLVLMLIIELSLVSVVKRRSVLWINMWGSILRFDMGMMNGSLVSAMSCNINVRLGGHSFMTSRYSQQFSALYCFNSRHHSSTKVHFKTKDTSPLAYYTEISCIPLVLSIPNTVVEEYLSLLCYKDFRKYEKRDLLYL
jgi:hypothetical protein